MLISVFQCLLAAVLVFQGAHVLGERKAPMGVIPPEVSLSSGPALIWGVLLSASGILMLALGLFHPGWARGLAVYGLVVMGLYGIWIVFVARKVEYQGRSSSPLGH